MPNLNLNTLASTILTAMEGSLANALPSIVTLAAGEAQKLAQSLVSIELMLTVQPPQITKDQATAFLNQQKNASQAVLTAIEGIGIVDAEQAINAGLNAVAQIVNNAIGFAIV